MAKDEIILETKRLVLRKLKQDDFLELCDMLQDLSVMYAWEKVFTDEEVKDWIKNMQARYELDGYAYYLAVNKETKEVVGQIGLLKEVINGVSHIGVGYMLKSRYFGHGYAKEGCEKCIEYAFNHLKAPEVIAEIRPENLASVKVAKSLNMKCVGEFNKYYNGKCMPHRIYAVRK